MLRMAFNVSWKEHMTNEKLYGDLPPVTLKIQQRRLRLAGHCWRHKEEIASRLVFWEPLEGNRNRGKQSTTYIDNLLQDTGMANTQECLHSWRTEQSGENVWLMWGALASGLS